MITEVESGLSPSDYTLLQTAEFGAAYKVTARRRNLINEAGHNFHANANYTAAIVGDYLFWAQIDNSDDTIWRIHRHDLVANTTTLSWKSIYGSNASGWMTPPMLVEGSDGNIYAYSVSLANSSLLIEGWNPSTGASVLSSTTIVSKGSKAAPNNDLLLTLRDLQYYQSPVNPTQRLKITASTVKGQNYPDNVLDRSVSSYWMANAATGILTFSNFQFYGSGIAIKSYAITSMPSLSPKNWTFQGSNDGSSWTTLDTQTNVTAWTTYERKVYSFTNNTAYKYYRINVSANNGASNLVINEVDFPLVSSAPAGLTPLGSAPSRIRYIAPIDENRVYYIFYDPTNNTFNLELAYFAAGVWSVVPTDYIVPHQPEGMGAARMSDGNDIITICTPLPGQITAATAQSTVVKRYVQEDVGIIAFTVNNNASPPQIIYPHVEIDIMPGNWPIGSGRAIDMSWLFGGHVATLSDGSLVVSALTVMNKTSSLSSSLSDVTGSAQLLLYVSKDLGKTWSAPIAPPAGTGTGSLYKSGILYHCPKPLEYGDWLLFTQQMATLKTPLLGSGNVASITEDITDYVEPSISLSRESMAQVSLVLNNADGHFDGHTWLNSDNQIELTIEAGYRPMIGNEPVGAPVLLKVGTFIVDSFERTDTDANGVPLPDEIIRVTARDALAQMSDIVVLQHFRQFDSQMIGGDSYDVQPGTNYGGLAHTAIQVSPGSYSAADGVLSYTPPAAGGSGKVFSTFASNIWNGEVKVGFTLHNNTASAVGILFRGVDKDNHYQVLYNPSTDYIIFSEIKNGISRDLATGTSLGWSASITSTVRYISVRFRYGVVRILVSNDGSNWIGAGIGDVVLSYPYPYSTYHRLQNGEGPSLVLNSTPLLFHTAEAYPLLSGYVGLLTG